MNFPDISPVALALGPLVIRWYALAYVAGILAGYYYVAWLNKRRALLSKAALDDLVFYAVLGIILGGRVGYVLFYNLPHYMANPGDILAVWHGGMSFHGGLLGVLVSYWFLARKHKVHWLALMDLIAPAAPIGLFLGRCANFVNGELYGKVTSVPWGIIFPAGGPEPRHPSQLYEAGLEGLLLGLMLFMVATRTRAVHYTGMLGGLFLAGYGLARFTVEFFREPDAQLGALALGMSMGQWLCVPMVAMGVFVAAISKRNPS